MKVIFIGAGPGAPDLLTIRAKMLLENGRIVIYAGSLVSPGVMALVPAGAEKHDSAGMSLEEIVGVCRSAQDRDIDVIRLHSGDPSIYGAIREQMNALDRLDISYQVVPGVSAFQAAAALLRTELTAPQVSQTIILTRTSGRTPMPPEQELTKLALTGATLCIYLSGHKVGDVAESLSPFYGKDCPAAVVYHVSWPDERIVSGVLGDIGEKSREAELGQTSLIIVGRALLRDIPPSRLYDAGFSHAFRRGRS